MYGKRDQYFNKGNTAFHNSIWIELIGFEKNAPDYGVEEYLETIGFKPDSISLHLTSVDFVNLHRGMETEYVLPPYVCSYGGHPENDQRKRQEWTNFDVKQLVSVLQEHGIKVFASFFDLQPEKEFSAAHPELLPNFANGDGWGIPIMIKRFSDGSFYEDYLLEKLKDVIRDYSFDGIQLADGISSPREAIWFADFSKDLIEQSGIEIPEGAGDAGAYISKYKRREWMAFYRRRWSAFLTKIIQGIKSTGAQVAVNSAWTRDPFEAIYRYGADYRVIDEAGADYFVVEDVSSDLAILGYEDNHCYAFSYAERQMIHFEFIANLMAIRAQTKHMRITPLFMIWDNQEQWDVLHHAPTAMQRAAAANFSHFRCGSSFLPITDGPHFCLGDALTKDDWSFIRLCLDNGYTPDAVGAEGATFIWSEKRMENELEEFIKHGIFHSAKWLAVLLRQGALIPQIANISDLNQVQGDLVITNYSLLPSDEKALIDAYKNGRVIKVEAEFSEDVEQVINPVSAGWPRPLSFGEVDEAYIKQCVAQINEKVNLSFETGASECTISEIITGKNTAKVIIENNEYFYVLPMIKTKRPIKRIKIITKPDGYPLFHTADSFCVRVAGRGVDIAEIEYEN